MEHDFALLKAQFIENYNLARPIMTILGDEVRQEILLTLIEAGGTGGQRSPNSFAFYRCPRWSRFALPMLNLICMNGIMVHVG